MDYLRRHFAREIPPALTPLAFDPGHPFPFISNLSQNLAVVVKHAGQDTLRPRQDPDVLPRFIPLPAAVSPGGLRAFVYLEDVIRANVQSLFPGTLVRRRASVPGRPRRRPRHSGRRSRRPARVDRQGLQQRRHGALAMLQVEAAMPRRVLDILIENFEVEEDNVYSHRAIAWVSATGWSWPASPA